MLAVVEVDVEDEDEMVVGWRIVFVVFVVVAGMWGEAVGEDEEEDRGFMCVIMLQHSEEACWDRRKV